MVDSDLVHVTKRLLGATSRKILVTGATGFVGRRVAAILAEAGHDVTATGRNRYLAPIHVPFVRADIRNAGEIAELCRNQSVVIHCASNTSPWASYDRLAETNVGGTENVIAGCSRHGVSRLVHVSSTSVQFGFRDAFDISENDNLPRKFACGYAETKHAAEAAVRAACDRGLNGLIVRARAVFGPGDQSLLPRMLSVYDQGKLRQIGDGNNVTDLTYVDNLVYALVLAIDAGKSGETCTITGGEPVQLWDLVRRILKATNRDAQLGRIPYGFAHSLAHISEISHRRFGRRNEPPLTRYTVGLLAKNQTFSSVAARRELGYQPVVSMGEGIERTIESLTMKSETDSRVRVDVQLFTTGYTSQSFHLVEHGGKRQTVAFHAMIALIIHPKHGVTLFDTGYSPRFHEATSRWPYRVYGKITPAVTSLESTCINVLKKAGVDPAQVKRIILSHLHADHVCGLRDFPQADIITTETAWKSVAGTRGWGALRRAFLPDLLPDDMEDRLCLLPSFVDPGIGPFEQCHDLFSDGSIRLINLPGHANGQLGALLQADVEKRKFLIADAAWTRRTITESLPPTFAFRGFADNVRDARQTLSKLCEFHQRFPQIELIPTHCPAVADQYEFDRQLRELVEARI